MPSSRHGRGLRWRVRWFEDGERRTRSFRTKDAALEWIAAYERPAVIGDVLVGSLLPAVVASKAYLSTSRRRDVDSLIRSQVRPAWGEVPLADVTPEAVRAWLVGMRVSPSRQAQCLGVLRDALTIAVERGQLPADPTTSVRVARRLPREGRFLTDDELRRLLAAVPGRGRGARASTAALMLELIARTGLRSSEACRLDVRDLDRRRARVRVRRSKTHRARDVAVPASLVTRIVADVGERTDGPLLLSSRGARWTTSGVLQALQRAADRANIGHVTVHDLRHTAASAMIAAGADVLVIQRQLGHASATMTLAVYGHLLDRSLDDVAGRMDAAWEDA